MTKKDKIAAEIESKKSELKKSIREIEFELYPKEVQWLFKNQEFFNVFAIEKAMDLKCTTLNRFFKYGHRLNEKNWKKVIQWIQKLQKIR